MSFSTELRTSSAGIPSHTPALDSKREPPSMGQEGSISGTKTQQLRGSLSFIWNLIGRIGKHIRGHKEVSLAAQQKLKPAELTGLSTSIALPAKKSETFEVRLPNGSSIQLDKKILPKVKGLSTDEVQRTVQEQIKKGCELLNAIQKGEPLPESTSENIACVIWALQAKAEAKVGHHSSGTITMEDPSGNVQKFLMASKEKYERISTHFSEFHTTQYGVDIRGQMGNGSLNVGSGRQLILPNQKGTILFGSLQPSEANHLKTPVTFIKMESYGARLSTPKLFFKSGSRAINWGNDIRDTLLHGLSLIQSKTTALMNKIFGAKGEKARKEHLSHDLEKSYKKLCQEHGIKHEGKVTVRSMVDMCQKHPALAPILAEINKRYDPQTLGIRQGNEVCFTNGELTT